MTTHLWSPPRLFAGKTIACLGGGPSLTQAQVDACRDRAHVIAINDAYRLAPWADVLYACDWQWWQANPDAYDFAGLKVSIENAYQSNSMDLSRGVHFIGNSGSGGIEIDPAKGVRTGRNGGYQAINLAVHLGARRIVLLGYDMQCDKAGKTHWFGDHKHRATNPTIFERVMLPAFKSLAEDLVGLPVEVVNATPDSALTVFPMMGLEEALGG